MDATLRWMLLGGLLSTATSALWFVWGRFSRSMHDCIFQVVSAQFKLSEHRFSNVSNLVAITKILKSMGLCTNRYLWQHDANADTGDAIMVGYIRLPTCCWFLTVAAMMGISHYIWICDDASEILIVGPSGCIDALLKVSNVSAHRQVTESELSSLRSVFRLEFNVYSIEWKCMWLERFICLTCCCGLVIAVFHPSSGLVFLIVLVVFSGVSVYCIVRNLAFVCRFSRCMLQRLNAYGSRYLHDPGRYSEFERELTLIENEFSEASAVSIVLANAQSPVCVSCPQSDHQYLALDEGYRNVAFPQSSCLRFSIVIARSSWYEIAIQKEMDITSMASPDFTAPSHGLSVIYACPLAKALPNLVACRIETADSLLYICVHNPMVDLNLVELRDLVNKADRNIAVCIILPSAHLMEAELGRADSMRLHGNKETRYMATFADYHAWLMLLCSGIFESLILIWPYESQASLASSQIWSISLSTSSCIIVS